MSSTSFSSLSYARKSLLYVGSRSTRGKDVVALLLLGVMAILFPWQLSLLGYLPNSIDFILQYYPNLAFLAHTWLLTADFLAIGPSFLQPVKEMVLDTPPWRLWGINATLEHPEYGLGLDFWSMKLRTDFPSYVGFQVGVFLMLLLFEVALIVSGTRLASAAFGGSGLAGRPARTWIAVSILALLLFDVIHFLL